MSLSMCVLFYSSFVCISACAYVYSKTTIIKQNIEIILIAGEPGGSGLPYYCTPPVCVSDVLGALAVCRLQTKTKQNKMSNTKKRTLLLPRKICIDLTFQNVQIKIILLHPLQWFCIGERNKIGAYTLLIIFSPRLVANKN